MWGARGGGGVVWRCLHLQVEVSMRSSIGVDKAVGRTFRESEELGRLAAVGRV